MESILWQEILAYCISSISFHKTKQIFFESYIFFTVFRGYFKSPKKILEKKIIIPPPSLQKPMSFCDLGSLGQVNVFPHSFSLISLIISQFIVSLFDFLTNSAHLSSFSFTILKFYFFNLACQ